MAQTSEASRDATFAFARKLRDRDFQRYLARNGYEDGQDIVIALPDEPTDDVFRRMFAQTTPPAVIAIWRPAQEGEFVFMTASTTDRGAAKPDDDVQVGSGATIGMLYDTLSAKTGQYTIPKSWGVHVRRLANA